MWRLRAGQCVRRFPKAHAQGVTCVRFSRDGSQVVSGSFDQVVRVHGLKSGKAIKEMRGHASYVNDVHFSPDGSRVVSASSDGTVRVWDVRSSECISQFRPPSEAGLSELSVNTVTFMPDTPEHLLVCNRSPSLFIMTLSGMLVQVAQPCRQLCRVASHRTPRRVASHTASHGMRRIVHRIAWRVAWYARSRGALHRALQRASQRAS